jgi:hypothetical protein
MFTAMCMKCTKTCKQNLSVKLVHCPLYEPRMDLDDLMDQLEKFELEALNLKNRTALLLSEAVLASQDVVPEEEERQQRDAAS